MQKISSLLVAGLLSAPLISVTPTLTHAAVIDPNALRAALDELAPVESVQFFWGGRRFCWYDDGWSGPGWYWCGYRWRRGFGWGGPFGWHGWRRPGIGPGFNRPGGGRPGFNRPGGDRRPSFNRPGGNRPGGGGGGGGGRAGSGRAGSRP